MIQTVSKYTFSQSPMLLRLEPLLLAQPLTDYVRPTKCQRQQGDHLLQSLRLDHVSFLKPKAATLQTAQQRFDLPSSGIIFYCRGAVGRCHHDELLTARQSHSTNPQSQTPDVAHFLEDQLLIEALATKHLFVRNPLTARVDPCCV